MEIRLLSRAKGGATDLEIEWYAGDCEMPAQTDVMLTLHDDRLPDATCPFVCVDLKELHAAVVALWQELRNRSA